MALKQAFSTTDGITDLLYVATHFKPDLKPSEAGFLPDMSDLLPPVDPGTIDQVFGIESGYEWSELFVSYYSKDTNTWNDKGTGSVNADVQADIQAQLIAIEIYNRQLTVFNNEYAVQTEVQWRKFMAQKLVEVCTED